MISGGSPTVFTIGPPEIIFDTPVSLGCHLLSEDFQINGPQSTVMSDLSPASCLIHCLAQNRRFAGTLWFI